MIFAAKRTLLGTLVVAGLAFSGQAQAAPQILGLVATAQPTQLICENGICQAEFSAVCLQKHRVSPAANTIYHQAANTTLEMTITKPDGSQLTMPLGKQAHITSRREFTSVQISVSEQVIRSLGGTTAAISVPKLASLVPEAVEGDPNPISKAEIAQFTGPLRATAEDYLQADPDMPVAQLLNRVLNSMDGNDSQYMTDGEQLWSRATTDLEGGISANTQQRVRTVIHECTSDTPNRSVWGTKGCVALRHGELLMKTTRDVWKGLGAGS